MRNLQLVDLETSDGLSGISDDLSKFSEGNFLSVDPDVGTVYVATPSGELCAFNPDSNELVGSISLSTTEQGDVSPVGLQYLFDQQSVCVATRDGRISLWQLYGELECVGEVEQGLTAMEWSPDSELVVITTGNHTLIMMTREFDAITEVPIVPSESGEEVPVTVGWGKKETQFHGSAGKQAAKANATEVTPALPRDHRLPVVRWRGDGQFFVVSTIEPSTGARFLYTWSRECVFQSVSEPVDGLQHSLYWKPSGSLIASVQTNKQKKQEVVFFEKNGLRHGEFPLTDREEVLVRSLSWNPDSSVLALCYDEVTQTDKQTDKQTHSVVQLWTVNNYHWYLKQTLHFTAGVAAWVWDAENFCRLRVLTRAGHYLSYTWVWVVHHGGSSDPRGLASVAVVDGDQLLVTPMRTMVVPPPMSAFTLPHPAPVNCVTFNLDPGSNDLATLMSDGRMAFWRYEDHDSKESGQLAAAGGDGFTPKCQLPVLSGIASISGVPLASPPPLSVSHLTWLSAHLMVFSTISGDLPTDVSTDVSTSHSVLHTAQVCLDKKVVEVIHSTPLTSHLLTLTPVADSTCVVVQQSSGPLLVYTPDSQSLLPFTSCDTEVTFPYPCTKVKVTTLGGEQVVLGLTEKFRFYVNDREISSNCTSFSVHCEFLLLTTLSHTVRCIPRCTKVSALPSLSEGKSHSFDESVRRVERGSQIVTVVEDDTTLVLQMPRGNLETIHPRALVLCKLKRMLDSGRVRECFILMRKHRINMNLLYDHDPAHFLSNIDTFVSEIQSVNHLNLFLTDLIEEDVTRTMYTASYQREVTPASHLTTHKSSKVDLICDAALAAFHRLDKAKYILCEITAHVKKTTPALEEALLLVWSLTTASTNDEGQISGVSGEEALSYLLFLVDVNDLYDVALGTYNFDLVMMVANRSQKDPKEYIPFLNELRRLEEAYRRYTIDKHLKKYTKALENIALCGEEKFPECLQLVTEHKLYSKALQLFPSQSSQYQSVCRLYGSYLSSKNRHDEAGLMYLKAGDWELALDGFVSSLDWRQALCMAGRLDYSSNRLAELAHRLAQALTSRQRYMEAAQLLEQYSSDAEEAIATLIQGCHWSESLRLMYRHGRLDLVETHLREALVESWEQTQETLREQRELWLKYRSRLVAVREAKHRSKLLLDGAAEYNDADADLFSDTTSMTGGSLASFHSFNSSRSTVFSKGSSGKSRRKAESKKWSLKEGSSNEEFALVDALAQIVRTTDGMKEDANSLMKALLQFHYDDKARDLQEELSTFLSDIQAGLTDIWIYNSGSSGNTDMSSLGPQSTASSIAQAMQRNGGKMAANDREKLDPVLLVPPTVRKDLRWKLHISATNEEEK